MLPDAAGYRHDPTKLRRLIRLTGMSQRRVARMIGVGGRTLRRYLMNERHAPYAVYYSIMVLATMAQGEMPGFDLRAARVNQN